MLPEISHSSMIYHQNEDFVKQIKTWQQEGFVITFTNGCFDILHAGHVQYLKEAAAIGDKLVIGLNSDTSVARLKGPDRPINTEGDRAIILSNLRMIDLVVIFEADTPLELIDKINPDYLVKGGDYSMDNIVGGELVRSRGNQVKVLSEKKGYSTSNIIAGLKGHSCK